MASFQFDFEGKIKQPKDIFNLINKFRVSAYRNYFIENKSYYNGENWTIMHLPDRTYWSDRIQKDKFGNEITNDMGEPVRVNALVKNPFVSNNRIAYGIFHDIVAQKVNTLLAEAPSVNITNNEDAKLESKFNKNLGYAFNRACVEASICGKSFIYEDNSGNLTVFDTANCIPFYDNTTGILKALIRFIDIYGEFSYNKRSIIAEVYTEDGLTIYEKTGSTIEEKKKLTPYKFKKQLSLIYSKIESIGLSNLPIIELRNNEFAKSDLTPSIRAKIDVMDMVLSGLINNIEDFSDVFWVLKKSSGSGMSDDDYQDFFANINKTKKLFVDDATPEQFNIPYEARCKAIEMIEQQIVKESGIIDNEKLSATQLTTTAIKASTLKLEQKVSDFEWYVNEAITTAVNLYKEYRNLDFEFEIDFTKLILNNATETIDNLIKIRNDISRLTVLKTLKKIGYIDSVEKELEEIEKDSMSAFSLIPEESESINV